MRFEGRDSIVAEVARGAGVTPAQAVKVLQLFLAIVRDQVWHLGRLWIPDLGVFTVRVRKGMRVRNPPGQPEGFTDSRPAKVVTFRASKNWRRW